MTRKLVSFVQIALIFVAALLAGCEDGLTLRVPVTDLQFDFDAIVQDFVPTKSTREDSNLRPFTGERTLTFAETLSKVSQYASNFHGFEVTSMNAEISIDSEEATIVKDLTITSAALDFTWTHAEYTIGSEFEPDEQLATLFVNTVVALFGGVDVDFAVSGYTDAPAGSVVYINLVVDGKVLTKVQLGTSGDNTSTDTETEEGI